MQNAIYLEPKLVPAVLRQGYQGTKFKAVVCESVTIPMDAGLWSGGSRDHFSVVSLEHGTRVIPGQELAPWARERGERTIELNPSIVVVEHSIFCGKDMGLTFYVHPQAATKLLPPPATELSATEKLVLESRGYKSSYMGKDRYQMMLANARYSNAPFPTRQEWTAAEQSLIGQGYLNKAGAITVKGRNAR